eukprot:tig00000852_g5023.t1
MEASESLAERARQRILKKKRGEEKRDSPSDEVEAVPSASGGDSPVGSTPERAPEEERDARKERPPPIEIETVPDRPIASASEPGASRFRDRIRGRKNPGDAGAGVGQAEAGPSSAGGDSPAQEDPATPVQRRIERRVRRSSRFDLVRGSGASEVDESRASRLSAIKESARPSARDEGDRASRGQGPAPVPGAPESAAGVGLGEPEIPDTEQDTGTASKGPDAADEEEFVVPEDESLEAIRRGKWRFADPEKRLEIEAKHLFELPTSFFFFVRAPPSRPRDDGGEEATASGVVPRIARDEGLYVERSPYLSESNLRRIEWRFLQEDPERRRLFTAQGDVLVGADPVLLRSGRPNRWFDPSAPHLELLYARRVFARGVQADRENKFVLEVDVNAVQFSDHPLCIKEDILAAELHAMHASFRARQQLNMVTFLTNKLEALEAEWRKLTGDRVDTVEREKEEGAGKEPSPATVERDRRLAVLRREIRQTRQLRDDEEEQEHAVVRKMISTWNRIKKLRQDQGFTSTTAKLTVRRVEADAEEDEARLRRDVEDEVALLEQEHDASCAAKVREYEENMRKYDEYRQYLKAKAERKRAKEERAKARDELETKRAAAVAAREARSRELLERERKEEEAKKERGEKKKRRGLSSGGGELRDEALEGSARELADLEPTKEELELEQALRQLEAPLALAPVKRLPKVEKPEPPVYVAFHRKKEAKAIQERLERTRRRPGEALLFPIVARSTVPTPAAECPPAERARRGRIQAYNVYARLLLNGQPVSRTKPVALGTGFTATFDERFSIHTARYPDSIAVQIMRVRPALADEVVATVYVPVPDPDASPSKLLGEGLLAGGPGPRPLQLLEFTGDAPAAPAAGLTDLAAESPAGRFPAGVLSLHASWAPPDVEAGVTAPEPPLKAVESMLPLRRSVLGASVSSVRLRLEEQLVGLDPNDPRNGPLLDALRAARQDPRSAHAFRPNIHSRQLLLHAEAEAAEGKEEQTSEGTQSSAQAAALARRLEERHKKEEERLAAAGLARPSDFLLQIRAKQRALLYAKGRLSARPALTDIVKEEPLPQFKFSIQFILELFAPRRKLRPARKTPKAATSRMPERCSLVVQVIRAYNLPVRSNAAEAAGPTSTRIERSTIRRGAVSMLSGVSVAGGEGAAAAPPEPEDLSASSGAERLQPYAEVRFMSRSGRTRCMEGSSPQWNEAVTMPVEIIQAKGFSPEEVRDEISINFFDESVAEKPRDDRLKNTVTHHVERRWLGSFSLPFTTLYANERIEGTFELETPMVNLGYRHEAGDTLKGTLSTLGSPAPEERPEGEAKAEEAGKKGEKEKAAPSMVSLFFALDPPLFSREPVEDELATTEERSLMQYGAQWLREIRRHKHLQRRDARFTVADINGSAVFVCRYVRAGGIAPPPELSTPGKVARFVSLIPFLEDAAAFKGRTDVWATCEEFLELSAGDYEEHAVLLCNLLNKLLARDNKGSAFVCAGRGIPEGKTYYVLVKGKESAAPQVWNAHTGRSYSVKDPFCPLQEIHYIFDHSNIWVNVQATAVPSRMSFSLGVESAWKPFFGARGFKAPVMESIQGERVRYPVAGTKEVRELEARVEQYLIKQFEGWRLRIGVTQWNRVCGRILKTLLPGLEQARGEGRDLAGVRELARGHADDLSQVLKTYSIFGFPINVSYTDLESVGRAVENTRIHDSDDRSLEFALAVHVHPYPCRVFSIWIYLASLRPLH